LCEIARDITQITHHTNHRTLNYRRSVLTPTCRTLRRARATFAIAAHDERASIGAARWRWHRCGERASPTTLCSETGLAGRPITASRTRRRERRAWSWSGRPGRSEAPLGHQRVRARAVLLHMYMRFFSSLRAQHECNKGIAKWMSYGRKQHRASLYVVRGRLHSGNANSQRGVWRDKACSPLAEEERHVGT